MNKKQIIEALESNHTAFFDFISTLSEGDFEFHPKEKWSGGQQMEHIKLSLMATSKALSIPAFILKWKFGKANRPSRSYQELVERYKYKLSQGGSSSSPFIPKPIAYNEKSDLVKKQDKLITKLCIQLSKYSESELDFLIVPHPLLGKITLRELMYFTIFHVQHHHYSVTNNLKSK